MKDSKRHKKGSIRKNKNLTTDDLLKGFETIADNYTNDYLKHKRRLGLSPGERLMLWWK